MQEPRPWRASRSFYFLAGTIVIAKLFVLITPKAATTPAT
jgi:hypothetical protein